MELDFSMLKTGNDKPQDNPGPVKYAKLDREQGHNQLLKDAQAIAQANISKGERMRGELIKGLKQGESSYSLLLKAMECIAAMTGDSGIYTQAQAYLLAVYGEGLQEAEPLQMLIDQTRQRLTQLEQALQSEGDSNSKQRISEAIKAHKKRIEQLTKAL